MYLYIDVFYYYMLLVLGVRFLIKYKILILNGDF